VMCDIMTYGTVEKSDTFDIDVRVMKKGHW
jgi:hypothetical protein